MRFLQTALLLQFIMIIQGIRPANIRCASVPECKCIPIMVTGYAVNCSNLNLTTVPRFSQNAIIINLSHNKITEFPNKRFPKNTLVIDLSFNAISKIHNGSLSELGQLQSLNLAANKLELNNQTYFPGIFKGLSKLKYLNLKHNIGSSSIDSSFYPRDFIYLTSLETLLIDGVDTEFGDQFSYLENLKTLDISGVTGKCSIPHLTSDHLKHLRYLVNLNISGCKILRIENGTLRYANNLQQLDISFNTDLTFRVLSNVTFDLQYTDIRIVKANKIHHTFGTGTELFKEDVKYLKNTSVEEVYLDSNRLEVVESGVFELLPNSVIYMSAADNKFTMGMYVLEFGSLKEVKTLNGSFQHIAHNPASIQFSTSKSCDTEKRYPCDIERHQNYVEKNLWFNVSTSNLLPNIQKQLNGNEFIFVLPAHLETIYFCQSSLQYRIPKLVFANNNLKYVDFSWNVLNKWEGPLVNFGALEYIDLSNNYCSYVSKLFFRDLKQLETLVVSNNILGFTLNDDIDGGIFRHLQNLKHLDICKNYIHSLSPKIFVGLEKLEVLNISNNNLREWQFSIEHMEHLKFIDFSNNQLNCIPVKVRNTLDNLSKNKNVTLDLYGNNFLCSCNNLDFMRWVLEAKIEFKNFKNYSCKYSNETVLKFQYLQESVLLLEIECSSKIGLIAGLLSAILLSVMVVVGGIIYRFRWKLRYLYYMTKDKYRGYSNINNSNYESHLDYDAFISYADEDRRFITKDMIENLEQNGGCRLCIHHRDFIPGLDIAENSTGAIHKSNKTVVILSSSFLKSYWCMYEFNMARMESIYSRDGRDVLFLVFYDTIQVRDLPLMMLELIDSQSYIEYPNDPQGNIVFWGKIKEAILM